MLSLRPKSKKRPKIIIKSSENIKKKQRVLPKNMKA
jgi:hypothetical protein